VKLEQARGARARRYCFYYDEVAEAEAQDLPYALVPRVLSSREWMERYGGQPPADQVINDRAGWSGMEAHRHSAHAAELGCEIVKVYWDHGTGRCHTSRKSPK
jgi:hypothetical protein